MPSGSHLAAESGSCRLGHSLGRESLAARLQALEDLDVLSNCKEPDFDQLVQLAATVCDTPVSLISLIGLDRQWFKAAYGSSAASTCLEESMCFHAIQQKEMLVVEDTSRDSRFKDFSCVTDDRHIRFYAGFPLRDASGQAVGTLCVLDIKPRRLKPDQLAALKILGKQVQTRLELKAQQRILRNAVFANESLVDALSQANDYLKRVLNAVPTIIIGLDQTGRVSYCNSAAQRMFPAVSSQGYGHTLYECGIRWLGDKCTIDRLYRTECADYSDHPFELDGARRWLSITVCPVEKFDSDDPTNVLLSGVDITDRHAYEEEHRQAQKMEAIGQLAAGIAHEINTPTQYVGDNINFVRTSIKPVTSILKTSVQLRDDYERRCGSTKLLRSFDQVAGALDLNFVLSQIPSALDEAFDGTQRIAHIVRAMKEFSHPGSQEMTVLDINHAVQITVVISRSEWKYVAELSLDLDAGLPHIVCYAAEINQVLLNLLVNAIHAIQEKAALDPAYEAGKIRIRTRQVASSVEVCIEDNGMGIPQKIQSRVYELFFTTKEAGKGTGQGLAFAHSVIVKKHGGQLWFESEHGKGTSFYFRLPLDMQSSGEACEK